MYQTFVKDTPIHTCDLFPIDSLIRLSVFVHAHMHICVCVNIWTNFWCAYLCVFALCVLDCTTTFQHFRSPLLLAEHTE